jgi:UrcA family protein
METTTMHRLTVGAFASALFVVTPSLAAGGETQKQVEVSFADIDTTTDRGADHALRRIRRAAEAVCEVRTGLQPAGERAQARACVNEAVENAVSNLADPMVTARYRGLRTYARRGERS